jgi:RNA polymerase sigma factor (sigma-70 family)
MSRLIHPTTQAGGPGPGVEQDSGAFLDDLRNGERTAYGRFFETYRVGIYTFVLRLTRGRGDASEITREVFVRAYRKILLHDGAIDLRPWVYGVALETCEEQLAAAPAGDTVPEPLTRAATSDTGGRGDLARRFRQASEGLSDRDLAVLLLHDVHGLSYSETAAVVGVSYEAAKMLLFRAGEAFRGAFESLSGDHHACRFAEQEAATSVGRGLSANDMRRLRAHARYCESCRTTTKAWAPGVAGLALFVCDAALPRGLQTVPVFGTWAAPIVAGRIATSAVAGAGSALGVLSRCRRVVGSKATAYAVAAACLVALVGVVVYGSHRELQRVILFVPRPPASTALLAPHASASPAAVHHAVRQSAVKATQVARHIDNKTTTATTTAPVATAELTSVHSGGTASAGGGSSSAIPGKTSATDGTASATGGDSAATTGAATTTGAAATTGAATTTGAAATTAAATTAAATTAAGSSTADHTAGTGTGSVVGAVVGAIPSRSLRHQARPHRSADRSSRSQRRSGAQTRARSGSRSNDRPRSSAARSQSGTFSRSGSGATGNSGRHRVRTDAQGGSRATRPSWTGSGRHTGSGQRTGSGRHGGSSQRTGSGRHGGSDRTHSRSHGGRSGSAHK